MTATPETYARLFDGHHDGRAVLDHLVRRFGGGLFILGGEDGKRKTDYRLGQRSVLDFILKQIDIGNGADPPADDPDDQHPAA